MTGQRRSQTDTDGTAERYAAACAVVRAALLDEPAAAAWAKETAALAKVVQKQIRCAASG